MATSTITEVRAPRGLVDLGRGRFARGPSKYACVMFSAGANPDRVCDEMTTAPEMVDEAVVPSVISLLDWDKKIPDADRVTEFRMQDLGEVCVDDEEEEEEKTRGISVLSSFARSVEEAPAEAEAPVLLHLCAGQRVMIRTVTPAGKVCEMCVEATVMGLRERVTTAKAT